jgi:O-antigen/teichoic acid export membrane protein
MQPSPQTDNRTGALIKNAGIYAIGVFGSRLMMFLLVPLYSFFIAPADYGYFDLCFMVVMLLFPILSLQLKEGAFRFLLEATDDERRRLIITFTGRTLLQSIIVLLLCAAVLSVFHPVAYLWYTAAFAVTFAFYEVWIQVVRGLGHNAIYAEAGILSSMLICVVSLVLVAWLKMDITGIFLGNIVGRLLALLFIEVRCGIMRRYLRPAALSGRFGREILRYSIPLIAVSLVHWTLSNSNRFFIEHYLGLEENGLFAIAQKFAAIFEALTLIGYQTWQEAALRHYGDADRDTFFSRIFNGYIIVLALLVTLISFGVKLNYGWLVGADYRSGILYLFPLVMASMWVTLSLFYDVAYQCAKQTHKAIWGLVMAAAVSLAGNFVFIRLWGIYGVLLTVNLAYLSLVVYRIVDTRKYFIIRLERRTLAAVALMLASGVVFYLGLSPWLDAAWTAASLLLFAALTPPYIRRFIVDKVTRRNNNPNS